MSKHLLLALGAGGAATAAVVASAAGFTSFSPGSLGAASDVVAACDTDGIDVDYTTSYTAGDYTVGTVTLSGVDGDCVGQAVKISLIGADNSTALATATVAAGAPSTAAFTGTGDARTGSFTMSPATVLAADVVNVAVVISG